MNDVSINFLLSSTGTVLWAWLVILYSFHFIRKVLPKIDKAVDPGNYRYLKCSGTDTFMGKIHRIFFYGVSAVLQWINGRCYPKFDFRTLQPSLLRKLLFLMFIFWIAIFLCLYQLPNIVLFMQTFFLTSA